MTVWRRVRFAFEERSIYLRPTEEQADHPLAKAGVLKVEFAQFKIIDVFPLKEERNLIPNV